MSNRQKFWFSGLWASPFGIAFSLFYLIAKKTLLELFVPGKYDSYIWSLDILVIIMIILIIDFIFFLKNLKRKLVDGRTDFRPGMKTDVIDLSNDKRKAQNHPVPKEYLSKEPDGFTLGYYHNRYLRVPFLNSPEHQLILGAPGSNKSTVTLNALIHNYNFATPEDKLHAVLAIDCKPELSRLSIFEGRNDVLILNPSNPNSVGFDPYYGLSPDSTDDELRERFDVIARTLVVNTGGDNSFFYASAQKILTATLMYGFRLGYNLAESIRLVLGIATEDLIAEILTNEQMESHPKIRSLVRVYDGKDSDAMQDVTMTLQQDLSIFDMDTVTEFFSSANNLRATPHDLINGTSLFLSIPDHLLKMYSPIFRMIVQLCLKHLVSVPEWTRKGKRPIWFLIDEAGSIGKLPDLIEEGLPRARSKGCQITLICQSYGQLETTYGEAAARSILDCCKTAIIFSCNDTRSAEMISKWTGSYRETKLSKHSNGTSSIRIPSSQNESQEYRPVMDVSDIKMLERNNQVLLFGKEGWCLCRKLPFYEIPIHLSKSQEIEKRNRPFYPRHP